MIKLKIQRINKYLFHVKNGAKIVQECVSYKEANNIIQAIELEMLSNVYEYTNDDLDEYEIMQLVA